MKFNKIDKHALIIGSGILVILVLWYFLFYIGEQSNVGSFQLEIAQTTQELERATNSAVNIGILRDEVSALETELIELQEKILSKDKIIFVVSSLQNKAYINQLEVKDISVNREVLFTPKEEGSFIPLPIHIQLQGEYKKFGKFLEDFSSFSFLIQVGELQITALNQNYPLLDYDLQTYVYVTG